MFSATDDYIYKYRVPFRSVQLVAVVDVAINGTVRLAETIFLTTKHVYKTLQQFSTMHHFYHTRLKQDQFYQICNTTSVRVILKKFLPKPQGRYKLHFVRP